MTISLYNQTPVEMDCEITSQGLRVRVENDQGILEYVDHEETVFVELDSDVIPSLQTTVTVHGGQQDAYVWEQVSSSSYARWDRNTSGYCHRTFTAPAEVDLQVVVLSSGSTPPAAPPNPGSGQAILKVKVRKKGELPLHPKSGSNGSPHQSRER